MKSKNSMLKSATGRVICHITLVQGQVNICMRHHDITRSFKPPCNTCSVTLFYAQKLKLFSYTCWKGWHIKDVKEYIEHHNLVIFHSK